jgi:hypothetical protein
VDEKPANERIAILETDMAAVKQGLADTKGDIKDINKTLRQVLISSLGGAVLILADVLLHLGK